MSDTSMFLYPFDHVFAIVDDHDAADAVLNELTEMGVSEDDIAVLTGDEGAARIDASGKKHGLLGRLWRAIQFTTMDAMPDAQRYEEAAAAGNFVFAVRASEEERRNLVHQILRKHEAHFINYYGKLTTMPLEEAP
jgi:hypothetical protein